MQIPIIILICCFMLINASILNDRRRSSRQIANENYKNDPIQKYVATHLGPFLPKMRDSLIMQKKVGLDSVTRHIFSWSVHENWKPDKEVIKELILNSL